MVSFTFKTVWLYFPYISFSVGSQDCFPLRRRSSVSGCDVFAYVTVDTPVAQTLDSAIGRYLMEWIGIRENQLRYLKGWGGGGVEIYPVDSVIYLSTSWALDRMRRRGWHIRVKLFKTVVNASQWINHYPVYNALGFPNFYPLDSNLSRIALSNIWTTVACVTLSDGRHVAKLNRTSQAKIRRALSREGGSTFYCSITYDAGYCLTALLETFRF